MGEIKTNDLQEIKSPISDNYKEIKPVEGMAPSEARDTWNEIFNTVSANENSYIEDGDNQIEHNDLDKKTDNPRYIITINESLENNRHPITGVLFERRIVELPNGEKIEGVFPRFDSIYDAKIDVKLYPKSDYIQFKECNKQLLESIENDSKLKEKFSEEQIEQIRDGVKDGTAPDGYVWNHDAEAGVIQLVDFVTHSLTGHTGGRSIWGEGNR